MSRSFDQTLRQVARAPAAQARAAFVCDELWDYHSKCCKSSKFVATIVLESLMRDAQELRHQIINLRDAMELEHDNREVQPVREESRDVQEEAAS